MATYYGVGDLSVLLDDNRFILRGFRGIFLMAQKWAPHLQHSVLFTRGEIPVHAEPIQVKLDLWVATSGQHQIRTLIALRKGKANGTS